VLINLCNYREVLPRFRSAGGGLPPVDLAACMTAKGIIKAHILGDDAEAETTLGGTSFVPNSGIGRTSASVLRGQLVVLMTSLNTYLKRSSGELLYSLCGEDGKLYSTHVAVRGNVVHLIS
jgi:hypothetical protein